MKKYLLFLSVIIGCTNTSTPTNSTYTEDNSFYGPMYQGFISTSKKEVIAPIQLSYKIEGAKVTGALKLGTIAQQWAGKISIPYGHFEGTDTMLPYLAGIHLNDSGRIIYYDTVWSLSLSVKFQNNVSMGIIAYDAIRSSPYSKSISGAVDTLIFEATK